MDLAAAWAGESPEASGAAMTEHRLVTAGKYGRQPAEMEGERAMSHCVDAPVEHAKVADAHSGVDRAATESERCQLPTCDDAVLPFRQRPNLPFALESLGATPTMRVRLTMHGNVKDTRNRIRP